MLDDTYNANDGSMMAGAASFISQLPGYKIFVAGDMAELRRGFRKMSP